MPTLKYKTNIRCGSCVAAVTPYLNGEESIEGWSVDTGHPDKILSVEGNVSDQTVGRLVSAAGFQVLAPLGSSPPGKSPPDVVPAEKPAGIATYYPLLLILAYLLGVVALVELRMGSWDSMRAMSNFMGGFFIVFSFFKLLDLRGFANAYATYDLLARRAPAYGYVYPFVELSLGLAYLAGAWPMATNSVTLAVMLLGLAGVSQALLAKRQIQCACLGTVFNLPMTFVTFLEDALMAGMAAAMLVGLM